jgi:hypothetical protein
MAFKTETHSTQFGYEICHITIAVIDDLSPIIIAF